MLRAVFYAMTTESTTEQRPWLELIGKDITMKSCRNVYISYAMCFDT